jgi:NAD(P)-dependent dehydrogenase (short-subunit alcohol dehydrogenase family)
VAQGKAGGAFFTTVSRLDGAFGLRGRGQGDATTGGLAGLAKSARHEWPEVGCKAVDVAASWNNAKAIARAIADECFMAGPAEVGLAPDGRVTPVLTETALDPNAPAPLAPGDVVVVSGGARGVTAEAAIALGRRFQPTLVLLGRSPLPEAEPAYLAGLTAEGEIKSALSQQPDGPKTPKLLQEAYQRLTADREVRGNLARLQATGARVIYQSVDVRDEAAVRAILATVRAEFGPIRGLVHGAGVLADKLIADKTPEQFAMVFDTKVQGLKALLKAVGDDELKAVALFSSVTGREGRKGQSDYAVANEVLNKVAQQLAAKWPACRVVSVNWGPWDGGMVTPALKRLFASEGVGVVPLEAGAAYLADELCQGPGAPVEVLVMGRPEGTPAPKPTVAASKPSNGNGNGNGRAKKAAVAFTRELDVARYPFLASHVINGKAVLPAAVMVEWMAHGALHANPGMAFAGLEDFRVYKGVILGAAAAANVRVTTASAGRADGLTRVDVELRGGDADVLHAQATVLLANQLTAKAETAVARPAVAPYDLTGAYGQVLFHGHDFQGITAVEGCSAEGIVARVSSAPDPRAWMAQPLRDTWLADPLALDAAFQLMILWSVANEDAPCLPCYAESYRQYRTAFPADGVTVVANVRSRQGNQLITDFAFLDAQGGLVAELLGAEATIDGSLKAAFRHNSLVAVKP